MAESRAMRHARLPHRMSRIFEARDILRSERPLRVGEDKRDGAA